MTAGNISYVRWRAGEPRRGRVFDPPTFDHPSYSSLCGLCGEPIGPCSVQLLILGADDVETAERHGAGRWYPAVAVLTHRDCLEALPDDELALAVTELAPAGMATGHDPD